MSGTAVSSVGVARILVLLLRFVVAVVADYVVVGEDGVVQAQASTTTATGQPNLLWIVTDQQRYDALSIVQQRMPEYAGKFKISTPSIDRLASKGAFFEKGAS